MNSRIAIVRTAKSYLGAEAGSIAHADILHIFNTVKPYGYTAKKSDPWCAEFVSACAIQTFGRKTAIKFFPLSAGCPSMLEKAKNMHIWVESDKYIPDKGDFILYDWQDSGKGDDKGSPDHVGIVERYEAGTIYIIEGNYSNAVKRRKIHIDARYIRGFITPDYDRIRVRKTEKTNEEIANEVIAGKWGNGAERRQKLTEAGYDYKQIQKLVNKLMKEETK